MMPIKIDGFVKSPKIPFSVIPAKAGIQSFQAVADYLDFGFHRSDDFLRDPQDCVMVLLPVVGFRIKWDRIEVRT